jgi:hypothetical protein
MVAMVEKNIVKEETNQTVKAKGGRKKALLN